MANDGGNLILNDENELKQYISKEPEGEKFIRPYIGSDELINNYNRYCFWLDGIHPQEFRTFPELISRIEKVRKHRSSSTRIATQKLADTPYLFGEIRHCDTQILVIPRVSSENRKYIPLKFLPSNFIVNDRCAFIKNATLYDFGVLTSIMHMTWVKTICGRLKSDYNYSSSIVYNNFPWPNKPLQRQIENVEKAAKSVLDIRDRYPNSSLADLYDPLTMPQPLLRAHNNLDKMVDLCYRKMKFNNEVSRVEFLFKFYEEILYGFMK